jgi:radical SAM superfamily enzyme YgiQ (UPF0313 family)
MRVLLVHAEFPITYWGFQYSLPLIHRRATLPPLGLVTVAALFPRSWELRLVDLNVEPLADADIRWADAVLVGGMLVQEASMLEVIERARVLGRRTVVGGPACTTSPARFASADCIFQGEAEGRVDELVAAVVGKPDTAKLLPAAKDRPSLALAVVPRFDLLDLRRYRSMCIQTSRGCPFMCEFCDIIEIFGRVPRVKSPAQVTAELDALRALGYRGDVFVVDDNFIGNKKLVRPILTELAGWQARAGHPFSFYTEASLNLAADQKLVAAMLEADFRSVFIGIETPDPETLKKTGKRQNVGVDVRDAIDRLTRAGLEVMGGFIVGFDGEGPEAFDAQRELLRDTPLPLAMVGLLAALPETALWRRLEREGRLREHSDGDAFERPNFQPTMPEDALLRGYAELLRDLYSEEAYFRRCAVQVERIGAPKHRSQLPPIEVAIALGAVIRLGLFGRRRGHFWRLVGVGARRGVHAVRSAISGAIMGEHMIRYTEEVVMPRLARALDEVGKSPASPPPAPARPLRLPLLA